MAYRNIFIANTSKLSTKNEQLIVDNGEEFSFPIEDVRCVLIEDYRSTVSTALMSKFAKAGVTLLVCDEKHIPVAALNPINCYSRRLRQIESQIAATVPFKKRIWQKIASQKIINQARCLEICGKENPELLLNLSQTVKSGDSANVEGRAAAIYFKSLFGKDFKRGSEDNINAALDYGYAIIRAIISRTVCLYGFEPSLGIHHCSDLNNFNLADDMIEPFRPVIDMTVFNMFKYFDEFNTAAKSTLLKAVNSYMLIKGKKHSVVNSMEILIQSYSDSLKSGKIDIILPELIETEYLRDE